MTDKQIIIDDQKKTIHRLQQECTEKTNAIIALGEQLARKTQECKKLKKEIRELSNAKLKLSRILDCYKQAYFSCQRGRQIPAKYKFAIPMPLPPAEFVDITRYRKALEEIEEHYEKVVKNLTTYDDSYDANISIEALHNISDIINKAKGEGDADT